jgi:23S rRNA (uracil1939-C5)-methyltransferase
MSAPLTRVEITGIAAGGDGVGRSEGLVIFTPRTAVGDIARVEVEKQKRFARGRLRELETPSPDRIEPVCPHYTRDDCGGCQLQHLQYDAQLRAKGLIIGDSIRRIGKRDVQSPTVTPSDAQWRYRRKLTLHVRHSGEDWIAGLHPYDDPVSVFDLEDCPITDVRVLDVWRAMRPAFHLLPAERALRVAVRLLADGAAAVVEGGTVWRTANDFFAAVTTLTELWWRPQDGRARSVASRERAGSAGASFVQVNERVAASLREHVLTRVRSYSPGSVVDAYAGSGDTSLPLSTDSTVTAIELDRDAVALFADRLRAPSRAIVGRVEDHLAHALPADVVILNPPRAGADERVTRALQNAVQRPRAIIYVSCDPATLSRDLARMPAYRLADVKAYDMFPQTAHVETVCELVSEAA